MRRYRSESSQRWAGFEHRSGDIVVSTRTKCGTTWMQMVCLSLIHGTPLPMPLALLSPWIDWDVEPAAVVRQRLAAQDHRRVIKTHTPLDGIPLHPDVRYIVVGRHPLDVAVSMYHHIGNLDQARSAELRGRPRVDVERGTLDQWIAAWVADARPAEEQLDTLTGNVHHIADAWTRQDDGNVLLIHFTELSNDREATMRRIAAWLETPVPDDLWPDLVAATAFDSMRADAAATVPDRLGVLKDPAAFYRSGSVGDGLRLASPDIVSTTTADVTAQASSRILKNSSSSSGVRSSIAKRLRSPIGSPPWRTRLDLGSQCEWWWPCIRVKSSVASCSESPASSRGM